ncbi:DUF2306 domain-containing protein [Hyphobacterium sp.]|jgi:uncharacterized membrane protein|uniref:DUF2306 domain-containing protein n=1 Tax=Hyphobacterium sp. TaxID=2004662 RepID=UPI003BAA64AB
MNAVRHLAIGIGIVTVVVGFALVQGGILQDGYLAAYWRELTSMAGGFRPDFNAFATAPLIIQIHAGAAIGALGLGLVQLLAPKGTIPHRTLGYVWVALMLITALTAIFIRQINDGQFSFIHIFVPLTLFGLFGLITHARALRTDKHRNAVFGLFFGALIVPGLFAFMPGRLMWQMFFGG